MKRLGLAALTVVVAVAAFVAGAVPAAAICGGIRSTYWACTGECLPGEVNLMWCEEYYCSDDSPTGRRGWRITNIC